MSNFCNVFGTARSCKSKVRVRGVAPNGFSISLGALWVRAPVGPARPRPPHPPRPPRRVLRSRGHGRVQTKEYEVWRQRRVQNTRKMQVWRHVRCATSTPVRPKKHLKLFKINGLERFRGGDCRGPTWTMKMQKTFPCSVALVSFCPGAFPCSVALVFRFWAFL